MTETALNFAKTHYVLGNLFGITCRVEKDGPPSKVIRSLLTYHHIRYIKWAKQYYQLILVSEKA